MNTKKSNFHKWRKNIPIIYVQSLFWKLRWDLFYLIFIFQKSIFWRVKVRNGNNPNDLQWKLKKLTDAEWKVIQYSSTYNWWLVRSWLFCSILYLALLIPASHFRSIIHKLLTVCQWLINQFNNVCSVRHCGQGRVSSPAIINDPFRKYLDLTGFYFFKPLYLC